MNSQIIIYIYYNLSIYTYVGIQLDVMDRMVSPSNANQTYLPKIHVYLNMCNMSVVSSHTTKLLHFLVKKINQYTLQTLPPTLQLKITGARAFPPGSHRKEDALYHWHHDFSWSASVGKICHEEHPLSQHLLHDLSKKNKDVSTAGDLMLKSKQI